MRSYSFSEKFRFTVCSTDFIYKLHLFLNVGLYVRQPQIFSIMGSVFVQSEAVGRQPGLGGRARPDSSIIIHSVSVGGRVLMLHPAFSCLPERSHNSVRVFLDNIKQQTQSLFPLYPLVTSICQKAIFLKHINPEHSEAERKSAQISGESGRQHPKGGSCWGSFPSPRD